MSRTLIVVEPKPIPLNESDLQKVAELLGGYEDKPYKYSATLNHIARPAVLFEAEDGEQRVLTVDTCKMILREHSTVGSQTYGNRSEEVFARAHSQQGEDR